MKWGKIYEMRNPCFLADVFVFTKIEDEDYSLDGKTIFVKVNSENKIEEIGKCIEGRVHLSWQVLSEKSDIASKAHIQSLKKIDMQYFCMHAIDFSKTRF